MKSNQEILDEFGRIIIKTIYDNQYRFIHNELDDLKETEEYKSLFNNMTYSPKKEIELYTKEIITGCIFDFLNLFEENEQFKLIYEESGKQVDLVKISEMLKSEPIIENGWIKRFSKYADKKEE